MGKTFYDKRVKLVVECAAHTVKTKWPMRLSTNKRMELFILEKVAGEYY